VPEISAMVLQEMKLFAEDYLSEPVTKAVITVPAYFNDNQRQATKDAGTIAGLDVIRIINEPTAAALAYGFGKNVDKTIAVFDLGGGTFDISVLEISSDGVFKVIATAGDTFLGGEDFDARIIDWLVEGFKEQHGVDLRQDRMALAAPEGRRREGQDASCRASAETEINLPFIISSGRNEALHLQRSSRAPSSSQLCEDLVERCVEICKQTLDDARLDRDEIEDVILVGGMTRMPRCRRRWPSSSVASPCKGVHPDEVVASARPFRAALVDDSQADDPARRHPARPRHHDLRVELRGADPARTPRSRRARSKIFTTSRDNQTAVKILVMQGDSEKATENELLGEFILTGLRRAPKGAGRDRGDVRDQQRRHRVRQRQRPRDRPAQSHPGHRLQRPHEGRGRPMMENAKDYLVDRRPSDEFEGTRQEAEKLIAEIEKMFPQVEQVVASSDFGRDAIGKARGIVQRPEKRSTRGTRRGRWKEQMFKGVVSR
jgi:molecular chaperone DnaK